MSDIKFIGLDVHKTTIAAAVRDQDGKLVMQSIFATHAAAILGFIRGLRGTLRVTLEEGTHSSWLYDLLKPHVAELLVCNPRKNALLKSGNKSDRIDARKLAELLRAGLLSAVYHGQTGTLTVKELARTYMALTDDTTRVMARLKALYRSQAIPSDGKKLYTRRRREQWLALLLQPGRRQRADVQPSKPAVAVVGDPAIDRLARGARDQDRREGERPRRPQTQRDVQHRVAAFVAPSVLEEHDRVGIALGRRHSQQLCRER